jgi:hypothetical protein
LDLRMKGPKASSLRGQLKASSLQDRLIDGLAGAPGEMIDAVRGLPSDVWSSLLSHSTQGRLEVALPRHAVGLDQSAGHAFYTDWPSIITRQMHSSFFEYCMTSSAYWTKLRSALSFGA